MYPKYMIAERLRRDIERLQTTYEEWDDDMCGLCCIAAIELALRFRKHGYENARAVWGYIEGVPWDHCWVELDGEIWDVTATQFGDDEIVRRPMALAKKYQEYVDGGNRQDSIRLSEFQRVYKPPNPGIDISKREGKKYLRAWPREQKPQRYYTKVLRKE